LTNRNISLGSGGGIIDVVGDSFIALNIDGHISGSGSLTKTGGGRLVLWDSNSYTGGTVISGPVYAFNSSGSATGTGDITINPGGYLKVGNWSYPGDNPFPGSVSGNIINNGTVSFDSELFPVYAGQISGTGDVGVGTFGATVTFTGSHTYTGSTYIGWSQYGFLAIGASERLPDTSRVVTAFYSGLQLNNFNETIGSLEGYGNVDLGSGLLTTGGNNLSTEFFGTINGSGRLTKMGSGTMTLSGTNTYSGPTTISGGTLSGSAIANIGINSSFGAGSIFSISNGAKLEYTGGTASTTRTISLSSGGGTIAVTNSTTTLSLSGEISGNGNLTKSGAGILHFAASDHSYTGSTTIAEGTLRLGEPERIPNGTALTVASGATFDLNSFGETIGSLAGGGSVTNGGGTLLVGGDNSSTTFSGTIGGSGGIAKQGSGTMTLSGDNSHGDTQLRDGGLALGHKNAAGGGTLVIGEIFIAPTTALMVSATTNLTGPNAVSNHINLHQHVTMSGDKDLEFSGTVGLDPSAFGVSRILTVTNTGATILSGIVLNGAMTKAGNGVLTLSGANTYGDGTTISGGTLRVNNTSGSATGTGSVTVSNGATLDGNGSITGNVSNSGNISPGMSVGTLSLGSFAQTASGKLQIELAEATHDQLHIGASAAFAGKLEVLLTGGYTPAAGTEFDILDFAAVTTTFDMLLLPTLDSSLVWDSTNLYTSGVLSVALAGDFNRDGSVDAADYVVWSKNGGTPEQFNTWRAHFGRAVGSGASVNSNVPEPVTFVPLLIGTMVRFSCRSRGKFD
jgi:autotransporter-associated beta strand protein